LRVFRNLTEARAAVLADFVGGERIDLPSLAKESAGAFGLPVLFRSYEGSTRVYHQYAVFAMESKVVVVGTLEDSMSTLWPECEGIPEDWVLAARITTSPGHVHLGHYRFQRLAPRDTPTLPDAPIHPDCPKQMLTYRIEDHFVDLDHGRELLALAQVFRGPWSLGPPAFVLPLDAITFDERGVVTPPSPQAHCDRAFPWPFVSQ
jgi:hypothetical protein